MAAVVEMQAQQVGQVAVVAVVEPPCCWSMDQQPMLLVEVAVAVAVQIIAVLLQPITLLVSLMEIPQVATAPVMAEVVVVVEVVREQAAAQDLTMPTAVSQVVQVALLRVLWAQVIVA